MAYMCFHIAADKPFRIVKSDTKFGHGIRIAFYQWGCPVPTEIDFCRDDEIPVEVVTMDEYQHSKEEEYGKPMGF